MMRPDSDNLFDDDAAVDGEDARSLDAQSERKQSDLADLLDSLADNEPQKKAVVAAVDDLEDLFGLFEGNADHKENRNERITLSMLPSEDEIRDLFSEDAFWDEDEADNADNDISDFFMRQAEIKPETPTQFSTVDQELIDLFKDESTDEDTSYPETLRSKDDNSFIDLEEQFTFTEETEQQEDKNGWDELENLLNIDLEIAPKIVKEDLARSAFLQHKKSSLEPQLETIRFYDDFDQLDSLLNEPSTLLLQELNHGFDFEELANLINTPAITVKIEPVIPVQVESTKPKIAYDHDDEFKDLEDLLAEANQSMGGPATVTSSGGQRLPSRRVPKAKTVEQTMRVPIKQLDNLSNLIGELVVKRNRLEQDQERLRLFLDNLLNQVQQLSDVGGRMQDLYERTLLEGALLASRNRGRNEGSGGGSHLPDDTEINNRDPISQDLDALEMDRFTDFHLLSQEMIELIVRVRESASDIQFVVDETDQVARSLRQATTQLQEGMTKSRMIAFGQTADRLPRAIREISLKLNKQAKLQVEGRDVLIDKMILEHLYNPMTHLVNNAITHGIETPEERTAKGKPPEGRILVRAFLQGNQTVISVADDGAGIDPLRVKKKAIEKDLITTEEALVISDQEVYDILFHPGFSTKDKADDFSGRGVGLDVVRKEMSEVRGSVTIDSIQGKGTTFTIRLPLTLSICKALCCLSNHARIAFPMDGVEDMKDFTFNEVKLNAQRQKCIPWFDGLLPFQSLSDLLCYNRSISRGSVYGGKQEEETVSIVLLRSAGNLLAVQVDQVLGEQEIVIKQLEGPIPKPPGIAGATVLGDGTVMPIGDVLELIEIAQGRMRTDGTGSPWRKQTQIIQPELETKTEPTVLIVDDSITVRELLSLSFNKAGYRVEQARDGQEAYEKLRSGLPCDIVFCDIEMPRMNGLELLSNIQKDPKLCDIPVALLTSRGAERHRKVAAKLGASGYFTKPYTERDLLDSAKRMIAGDVLLAGSTKAKRKSRSQTPTNLSSKAIDAQSQAASSHPTIPPTSMSKGGFEPSRITTKPNPGFSKGSNLVLIIDDSVMVREMLSMTFTKAGYEIEQARDGQDAWEKLRGGLSCALILCDIEMPRMNGLELLSRLQEDEKLSVIPVAMITSRGAQKMQNIAAERGAKGYFVKPYIEEVLLDSAKRLIAGEVLLERSSKVES